MRTLVVGLAFLLLAIGEPPAEAVKGTGSRTAPTGSGANGAVMINPNAGSKTRVQRAALPAKPVLAQVTVARKGKVARKASSSVTCKIVDVRSNQNQMVGQSRVVTARKQCSNGTSYVSVFCVENCARPPAARPQRGAPPSPAPPVIIEYPSASEARNSLGYALPAVRFSPEVEDARASNIGGYLVGMPTYFAVQTSSWTALSATATRGPASITVDAEPIGILVQLPGRTIECEGPGVVITAENVDIASQECAHVFQQDGAVNVSVQIKYIHSYSANFTPATPFPVNEISYSPATVVNVPVVQVQPVIVRQ